MIPHQTLSMTQEQYRRSECLIDGVVSELTTNETELLLVLMSHRGEILTTEDLVVLLWPDDDILPDWGLSEIPERIAQMQKKHGITCIATPCVGQWIIPA